MKTHYENVQEIVSGLQTDKGFPMVEAIRRLTYAVQFLLNENAKLKKNLRKVSEDIS